MLRPASSGRLVGLAGLWTIHLLLLASVASAADLVLLRARCLDPLARTVDERSLWIRDGVIEALGTPDGGDLPPESAGTPRFDLASGYVLPGLADAWVHAGTQRSPGHRDLVGARGTARLMLAAGVVEFVDVHLEGEALLTRERIRSGEAHLARMRVGGPLITAQGGVGSDFPGARQVRDLAGMTALVDSLAALPPTLRPDLVAVVFDGARREPRLSRDLLERALERASAAQLEVAVQVGTWRDAFDALGSGATWLVQLPFGPAPEALRELLADREVIWTPTLAVGLDFAELVADPSLRQDPLLAVLLPDLLLQDYAQVRIPQGRLTEVRQRSETLASTLAFLRENGVRLRAGSAAGALGTAFGWSLLRELEWMVRLGVDPWEALASAMPSGGPAKTSFAVGAPGDLLVLPRSPLEDLSALRALEAVVFAGERLDPRAIAAVVEREIEEEIPPSPLPFGGRVPLIVVVAGGFALLLMVRRAIKRAAAHASRTGA